MADPTDTPPWLYRAVVGSTWRVVGIVLIVLGGLWVLNQASTLAIMLVVACFLALAMVPGVEALARRFHWKRGAAAGAILIGVFGTLILLIAFLIPALIDMTSKLSADVPQWAEQLNQHGIRVGSGATENSQNVIASIEH
ncbi:MAG: AI-2E family transporter, partial [Candidatus Nanopelagicales bacterium]